LGGKKAFVILALALLSWGAVWASSRPAQVLAVPGRRQRVILAAGEVWLQRGRVRRSLRLARYHPWKIGWARVAGQRQLAVAVYKRTRFMPQPHNALFLYDWNDGRITPRWLGSRLSKPFTDFAFADLRGSGETELVSVEKNRDGRVCLMVYRWTGFGFEGEWQSQPYRRIRGLTVQGPVVAARVRSGTTTRRVRIGWREGAYGELAEEGETK